MTVKSLHDHDSGRLDWDGLKQELEALGRQEYRELVSRLGVLLGQNPSLCSRLDEPLEDGFQGGVDLVLRESDLPLRALPQASPWSLQEALDPATLCDTRGDWSDQGL
ncbi:MAG: DUF29 family protein [Prochlorococcaceae cyanobacterium]